MPGVWLATRYAAQNQTLSGVWLRSMTVPTRRPAWRRHARHSRTPGRVTMRKGSAIRPQCGQRRRGAEIITALDWEELDKSYRDSHRESGFGAKALTETPTMPWRFFPTSASLGKSITEYWHA